VKEKEEKKKKKKKKKKRKETYPYHRRGGRKEATIYMCIYLSGLDCTWSAEGLTHSHNATWITLRRIPAIATQARNKYTHLQVGDMDWDTHTDLVFRHIYIYIKVL
jgi:hypothetical protein